MMRYILQMPVIKQHLEEADRSLDLVRNSIEMGMPEDFFLYRSYECI